MTYRTYLDVVANLDMANCRAGRVSGLTMERVGNLTVEYAPFDHIERRAQLVLVGLTPGRTQAANALQSMSSDLRRGIPPLTALANAKRTASFSGSMRANLLAMLDTIGVPEVFGRRQAAEFFAPGSELVHFTSALRYPVFLNGQNYSGSPDPLGHSMLRRMIEIHLAEEAAALPNAIWIPLGRHAEAALLHLSGLGRLDRRKVLVGLPHPSGANAERIAYFLGRKPRDQLSPKTNAARLEMSKAVLSEQVSALRWSR